MKDPDLLAQPEYVVRSVDYWKDERFAFIATKYLFVILWIVSSLFYGFKFKPAVLVLNVISDIYKIVILAALVLYCVPRIIVILCDLVGEKRRWQYTEMPMELRIYRDCIVVYQKTSANSDRYIQMPYDNIRRCKYDGNTGKLLFVGRFEEVIFRDKDATHDIPIYRTVLSCEFPVKEQDIPPILDNIPTGETITIKKYCNEENAYENP